MTTNSPTAEDRLATLGIHLPDAPTPFGAYVPAVQTGALLFLSGMLATSGHTATVVGVVGKDLDVCTHPEFRGRGYARALVTFLAAQILAAGKTPFLHVKSENGAKVVYQKTGFRLRAAICLTVISLP